MANDLGDVLPLSITIYDVDGYLANAGNVSLTITRPDGTTVTQASVAPDSVGVYVYPYVTTQAGRHTVYWLATGDNASAYSDVFYVTPTDNGDFISLLAFKNHIKKTDSNDDESIRTFISGACATITDRVGPVAPRTYTETRTIIRDFVSLYRYPVLSITSALDSGNVAVPYVLENADTGLVSVDGYGSVTFTYKAGLTVIPQNYILAALELTHHLWKNSQQNAGGGRPPVGLDEVIVPGVTYALPYNVRQLLGLDKMSRKQVWI